MPEIIKIHTQPQYEVRIEAGSLAQTGALCRAVHAPCRAVIVTDSVVAPLYLARVSQSLESAGFTVLHFVFPCGESSKNINTLSEILEFCAEQQITSQDLLVALGGGVTGDITGLAAAIYLRGVRFVQIPTTLLAMVDSSVGGKTAIDLKAGKNLAGAFYQPSLVICDPDALQTLKDETFADGMAEVIKYGMIFDRALFDAVSTGGAGRNIAAVIRRCVELKRDVVEADERDHGVRQLLNFGHTVGHAVETCSGFTIPHGSAVAIGMVIASKASFALGLSKENCVPALVDALRNNALPTACEFSAQALYGVSLNDKKRRGNTIHLIVPERVGHCVRAAQTMEQLRTFIQLGV